MLPVTWHYMITVGIVSVGSSFQFYSFQVVNSFQVLLQNWINQTYISRDGVALSPSTLTVLWSFIATSTAIGAFCGSLVMRSIAERLGRRDGIILNAAINVVGGAVAAISQVTESPELLLVGRILLGVSIGLCAGLVPMYLTEITPFQYRGAAATAHMIAIASGDLVSMVVGLPQLLGTDKLWPVAMAWPSALSLFLCVTLPFCPRSPRFLMISLNRREETKRAIRQLVGPERMDSIFHDLVKEAALVARKTATGTVKELFGRKSLRTPLMLSILVMIAQQFTGVAAVFMYSTDMFLQAGLNLDVARLSTAGIGFAYFVCVLPSPYLIEKFGRRPLELFQLSGCLLSLALLSICNAIGTSYELQWAPYMSIASLVLYMCVYGSGCTIAWLLASELFSQENRSAAVFVSTCTSFILEIFLGLAYLPFQRAVGQAWSFVPFIVVLLVSIIGMGLLLPETKNRTIEDIVKEFRQRSKSLSQRLTFSSWRLSTHSQSNERLLDADTAKHFYGALPEMEEESS